MNALPAAVKVPSVPAASIREHAAQALRAGATHYTDRAGIAQVRAALAQRLGGSADLAPERVIVTAGREESLFLVLRGLLERGSTVASAGEPRLHAVAGGYEGLLESLGLVAVAWPSAEQTVTCIPNALLIVDDGRDVQSLVRRAAGLGVLVVILELLLADASTGSLAASGLADSALLIGDFAGAGLRSWGVGYVVGPSELLQGLVDLKQGLNICTAGVSQHAAAAAVEELRSPNVAVAAVAGPPVGNSAFSQPPGERNARLPRVGPRLTVADEATRQRYELLDLLAVTPGAITLGRGDPDLPTPAPITEAAIAAMGLEPGSAHPLGLSELRHAIADKLDSDNGIVADPDSEILVTTGGQEAIFLVLQTLLEPGDEILLPSPRYTSYDVAVNVAGARIVDVAPPGPFDFSLDAAAIEAAITPRTRALLIISPGNPTAAVADAGQLAAVAQVAQRHGLTVISDEIYERIVYDGAVHTSIASLPGMAGRAVTVGGFSKAYAMTGWRVGYLVGSAQTIAAAAKLKQLWSGPTSRIAQYGALAALRHGPELVSEAVAVYTRRREMTLAALRSFGTTHAPAQGAFYVFFDVSEFGLSSYQVSRGLLLGSGVFLYPGSSFGSRWSGHMRLAWLQPEHLLEQALTRIGDWIGRHR